MHHSISTTPDDFDYFRRSVGGPLPWPAGSRGAQALFTTVYGCTPAKNPVLRGIVVGRLSAAAVPALLLCMCAFDVAVDWALGGNATH